ncbi:MAG: carboxyl transferase domain-containing protein [Pseudomonadota bacterium]
MSLDDLSAELNARRDTAMSMGGKEKLARRKEQGLLNARERIEVLLDSGSFTEAGLLGVSSVVPGDELKTPADGKISGYGKVDGRRVAVVSNDLTVKGASSSMTNMKKIGHIKRTAASRGLPIVFLGESSGARMPDNMGAKGMGTLLGNDPTQYQRLRETPWISALLGPSFGSSALYACMSDFVVMRKGATMAVASARLVELATGQKIDQEDMGGWEMHAKTTGLIDAVAETDEEAIQICKKILSYLPSHQNETPPRTETPASDSCIGDTIRALLPDSRTRGYDMRRMARAVLDPGSDMELKPMFGKSATTMLGRINGRVVGVVGNNPMFKGGTLDVPSCEKITSFLVLCDSYNIPLVFLVDTPGFMIGIEAERQKAPGKIINFMNALQLLTVPKVSLIMRKTYGQAYLNMGGGRNSDEVAAWPTAEVSFMDPAFSAHIVGDPAAGQEELDKVKAEVQRDSAVWDIAGNFSVQYVLHPEETRAWLEEMLDIHEMRLTGGIGQHRLATWPTSY